jgi:hypothetical protein
MACPSFVEIGDSNIARIRRPHLMPSPTFGYSSFARERVAQESTVTERPLLVITDHRKAPSRDAESRTPEPSQESVDRQESDRAAAERKIENVDITTAEQESSRRLAPHLGDSPRRIKRYANTYRLLKSGLTREEARQFAEGSDSVHDYQIVLVFLAVVTGAPNLAPEVFSKAFELRNIFKVSKRITAAGLEDPLSDPFQAANAKGALGLLAETQLTGAKIEIWIPRVMRYAFRPTPVDVTAI